MINLSLVRDLLVNKLSVLVAGGRFQSMESSMWQGWWFLSLGDSKEHGGLLVQNVILKKSTEQRFSSVFAAQLVTFKILYKT